MKVIIAGMRDLHDRSAVWRAIEASGFEVTEVVSGAARGVDALGEAWARFEGLPVKVFPADWSRGPSGGPERNRKMAAYADALIAVWDGKSRGTRNMIDEATKKGLGVSVYRVDG